MDREARFDRAAFLIAGLRSSAPLIGALKLGELVDPMQDRAARLQAAFAVLAEKGAPVASRVFLPGETVPWPVPIQIGEDWTLSFPDQPAVTLLRSLGLDDTDGQLTIVSNNVLLEQLDSAQIDYAHHDRQITYWGSTTPGVAANRWRVRPALTTDRAVDGADFDKLRIEIAGPLRGFGQEGQPIRKPSYELAAAYRLNWFGQRGEREETIVDPARETCISEQPLDPGNYRIIRTEVELYRSAVTGIRPVVMVSKPRQLQGGDDYYEANYDSSSGVALINSFYLTPGEHPALQVVVDRLLGSAIFLSAALSRIPKLVSRVERFATEFNRATSSGATIATFADVDNQPVTNESELFAEGLNVIRHRPALFLRRFDALDRSQRGLARSLKNDIVALTRLGLDLNGQAHRLHQFVPPEIQRL